MRCLPIAIVALALGACNATLGPANADSRAEAQEDVEFDIRSWGKLVSHWRVGTNGSGEIWRVAEGATMSQYDVRKFRLHMDMTTLARFRAASGALKQATRRKVACEMQITDMHYGDVVWSGSGAEQKFGFNYGCRSRAMDRAFDLIQQANEVVAKQATIDAEPFAVEHIGPR